MLFRLSERVGQFLHPFRSIAKSLDTISRLYELEMAERIDAQGRARPIRLVTEAPSRGDTEVLWTGIDERKVKVDIFQDASEDED